MRRQVTWQWQLVLPGAPFRGRSALWSLPTAMGRGGDAQPSIDHPHTMHVHAHARAHTLTHARAGMHTGVRQRQRKDGSG